MQWSKEASSGFTSGKPWLALNSNYKEINVQAALMDPQSIFYTYQHLIKLRHENKIVVSGSFITAISSPNVLAYYRELNDQCWLIVANLSENEEHFSTSAEIKQFLISNYSAPQSLDNIVLRPYEAFAVEIIK